MSGHRYSYLGNVTDSLNQPARSLPTRHVIRYLGSVLGPNKIVIRPTIDHKRHTAERSKGICIEHKSDARFPPRFSSIRPRPKRKPILPLPLFSAYLKPIETTDLGAKRLSASSNLSLDETYPRSILEIEGKRSKKRGTSR